MKIAPSLSAIVLAGCSATGNPSQAGELSCRQYLTDTGYGIIDGDAEKKRVMDTLGVPFREHDQFCFGRLPKPTGGVCYLALPTDDRTDGDYTDCPVDALR